MNPRDFRKPSTIPTTENIDDDVHGIKKHGSGHKRDRLTYFSNTTGMLNRKLGLYQPLEKVDQTCKSLILPIIEEKNF